MYVQNKVKMKWKTTPDKLCQYGPHLKIIYQDNLCTAVTTVSLFVCRTENNESELEIQTDVFILHSRLRLTSQKRKAWSDSLPWQCEA